MLQVLIREQEKIDSFVAFDMGDRWQVWARIGLVMTLSDEQVEAFAFRGMSRFMDLREREKQVVEEVPTAQPQDVETLFKNGAILKLKDGSHCYVTMEGLSNYTRGQGLMGVPITVVPGENHWFDPTQKSGVFSVGEGNVGLGYAYRRLFDVITYVEFQEASAEQQEQ